MLVCLEVSLTETAGPTPTWSKPGEFAFLKFPSEALDTVVLEKAWAPGRIQPRFVPRDKSEVSVP